MSAGRLSQAGTALAFLLLLLAAFITYVRSQPPTLSKDRIITELDEDLLFVQSTGKEREKIWTLKNRWTTVKVEAQTAHILEMNAGDEGPSLYSGQAGETKKRFTFSGEIKGHKVTFPAFTSTGDMDRKRAWIKLSGVVAGMRQEILMTLKRGSPSLEIRFRITNLGPSPVKGDFTFSLNGSLGRAREDDLMLVPAQGGLRILKASSAFLFCPERLHLFRGWYGLMDPETDRMLLVSCDRPEEYILSNFSPLGYEVGLSRDKILLQPKGGEEISFKLTPLDRYTTSRMADQTRKEEVENLFQNRDLLLDRPAGSGRVLSAPWGTASAELTPSALTVPSQEVTCTIRTRLNRATRASPDLVAELALKEHGQERIVHGDSESFSLGGWFGNREEEISFTIPEAVLHRGRFDVEWRIRKDQTQLISDRLNLAVSEKRLALPPPDLKTDLPLERVIARRMSQRVFTDQDVSLEALSYILFHGTGLMKDREGRVRETNISEGDAASGRYEVFVYFVHEGAVYRYNRLDHTLEFHQARPSTYVSELEKENLAASARMRTVQAPVMIIVADGGGASKTIFQTLHLAASALGLGFCIFGEEKHAWLDRPKGYRELYGARLGHPSTPFLFMPKEVQGKTMPLVDAVWNERGQVLAQNDPGPREPEMTGVSPNLGPIIEHDLTLEAALEKAVYTRSFSPQRALTQEEKSQLLWAAYGRSYLKEIQEERDHFDYRRVMFVPGGVHRTVPSACGEYLMDLYMADETGVYQYFGKRHYLHLHCRGDRRKELLTLFDAAFENPAVLFFFARRDSMENVGRHEGFEEGFFAAQNMALVGASMEIGAGLARVDMKPEMRKGWKKILGGAEAISTIPLVGGKERRAKTLPLPGIVVAAGGAGPEMNSWLPMNDYATASALPERIAADPVSTGVLTREKMKKLVPGATIFERGGRDKLYHRASRKVRNKAGALEKKIVGFLAETRRVAPEVMGYHGPIEMILSLTPNGLIQEVYLVGHEESREHMNRILASGFLDTFKGRTPGEMSGADMVSGATASCVAMARAVYLTQDRLCGSSKAPKVLSGEKPDLLIKGAVLAALFAAALCLSRRHRIWRYGILSASLLLLGVFWNWSFTYTDLLDNLALLGQLTALFATLVLVSTLLKGRIYCGWLCPFGAVQELLASATGGTRRQSHPWIPFLKYLLLPCLLAAALVTGIKGFMNPEPFADFFNLNTSSWRFYLGLALIGISLIFTRPFCRWICPTGAFLGCIHRLKGAVERRPEFAQCKACGRCSGVCPTHAVVVDEKTRKVLGRNRLECIDCGECLKATQKGACSSK